MKFNFSKLNSDFLAEYPYLIKLSKTFKRKRNIGLFTIISTMLFHLLNFSFWENFAIGIVMLIIPSLILVFLYFYGASNFISEFDIVKTDYIQRLLDGMENSDLKFVDSLVEMNVDDVNEIGFLRSYIAPPIYPIRRNLIIGTYKDVNVKIGELDFRHPKYESGRMWGWMPSTLLVFEYPLNDESAKLSFYVERSVTYRELSSGNDRHSIYYKKNIINLNDTKIKTNIRSIDLKYLTFTTDELAAEKILNDKFKSRLEKFNQWKYKRKGLTRESHGRFLTVYQGKISILIYRQKFMEVQMDSIFESYHEEIKSILEIVDIFAPPGYNANMK